MPRHPSKKRNRRQIKHTVLAVGEGNTEKAFLKYLKSLYGRRYDEISIKVESTQGGSPKTIIYQVVKMHPERYDTAFLLLDTQPAWPDKSDSNAKESNLDLIGSVPCVEGLFLTILNPRKEWGHTSPAECKRIFERKYIGRSNKFHEENYYRVFPKDLLEKARNRVPALDKILKLMFEKRKTK